MDVYLSVAYEQAEKGDLEAAKKTFAEAIQFELKQNPGVEYKLKRLVLSKRVWD